MIEYKVYITNPQYFNSIQNNFEKNLYGSIFVDEKLADSGMTERTAIGKIYGIPVPFTNPQTNIVVENNDGSIIQYGEPSMFLPPKTLATEMMATIRDVFFVKYGVNIDLSLDAPEQAEPEQEPEKKDPEAAAAPDRSVVVTPETPPGEIPSVATPATPGVNLPKVQLPKLDGDLTKGLLIGAGVIGAGALAIAGINALKDKKKDKQTATSSGTASAVKPTIEQPPEKKQQLQILVPSQYLDVYMISSYGGEPALMTTKESKQMVWIDTDLERPEFNPGNFKTPLKTNTDGTGDFGINIHLGYPGGKIIGDWSIDGSQVFSTQEELREFFTICEKHRTLYNLITYTICTRVDWDEAQKAVSTNKQAPPEAATASAVPIEDKPGASASTTDQAAKEVLDLAFQNLNFDTDKDTIRAESFDGMNKLAELLKKETSWKLLIEGHTDSVGTDAYNLDLSKRRAASAKKYLVGKGAVDGMITTQGYGESKPIADNKTAEGRQKNRRVDFTITKPDGSTITSTRK